MGESLQVERRSLERVREALNKVRKVLGALDQSGDHLTAMGDQDAGERWHTNQGYDELRAHEAARVLNMPLRDLYAAVHEHRLPARRLGRFLWIRRKDLDAFANESPGGRAAATPHTPPVTPATGAGRRHAKKRQTR